MLFIFFVETYQKKKSKIKAVQNTASKKQTMKHRFQEIVNSERIKPQTAPYALGWTADMTQPAGLWYRGVTPAASTTPPTDGRQQLRLRRRACSQGPSAAWPLIAKSKLEPGGRSSWRHGGAPAAGLVFSFLSPKGLLTRRLGERQPDRPETFTSAGDLLLS